MAQATKKTKPTRAATKAVKVARGKAPKKITRRAWCMMVAAGILSVLFGLVAMFWPGITFSVLMIIAGGFAVVLGIVWLCEALCHKQTHKHWWFRLLLGLGAIVLGIFLLLTPDIAVRVFTVLLAIFAIAQSILDFIAAGDARGKMQAMWITVGVLGLLLGALLIWRPEDTIHFVVLAVGIYAVLRGVCALVFAAKVKPKIEL